MKRRIPHAVTALLVAAIYYAGGLEFIERHLMDLRFEALRRPAEVGVVVVSIDPTSLKKLKQWPWPRGYYATVLDNLVDAGASRIAFDIDFSSHSIPEEDEALEEALIAAGDRVFLPVFHQWQSVEADGFRLVTSEPIAPLATAASLATINIRPEESGRVRRYWVHDEATTSGTPSLALALAGEPDIPASFYIDYGIRPETISRLPFLNVLTGQFDPAIVAGKPVIVGATAVELGDQLAVPVHTSMPGPVLQALAFESIAAGRNLARMPVWFGIGIAIALGCMVGPAIGQASWRLGLASVTLGSLGMLAVSVAAQWSMPIIMDTTPIILTLMISYGIGLVGRIDHQNLRHLVDAVLIKRSELRMRHVVEHSFDAIVTLDNDGKIESFNPAAEILFGSSVEETVGKPLSKLVPMGMDEDVPSIHTNEDTCVPALRQAMGRRRDGSTFPMEVSDTRFTLEGKERRVAFMRDITERKAHEEALEFQATHDVLTGLPNRTALQRRIDEVLEVAIREDSPVAFLLLDLDRFKEVNDTLGHHVGDLLLQKIAQRLRTPLRSGDLVARLGGDEFAVLLPWTNVIEAGRIAQELIEIVSEPFDFDGLTLQVDTSIGIAMYPDHGSEAAQMIQRADVAMYVAKKVRNAVSIYNPDEDFNSIRHLTLKGELRQAVEQNHLILYYQPKICSKTGRVDGAEALVRWQHAKHGLIPPNEFIPLAEYTGLIKPITYWVLDAALRQAAQWQENGYQLPISINCSARNLLEEDLPIQMEKRLKAHGIKPAKLILEITETAIIEDPKRALEVVSELAELGIKISIDDFGTGYSSLDYLMKLPACELKIDKSFVMGIRNDEANAMIVRSTIDLAHNFGLKAVAEGVDTPAVWRRIRDLGCDSGQGYLFARPMAAESFGEWLMNSPWGLNSNEELPLLERAEQVEGI